MYLNDSSLFRLQYTVHYPSNSLNIWRKLIEEIMHLSASARCWMRRRERLKTANVGGESQDVTGICNMSEEIWSEVRSEPTKMESKKIRLTTESFSRRENTKFILKLKLSVKISTIGFSRMNKKTPREHRNHLQLMSKRTFFSRWRRESEREGVFRRYLKNESMSFSLFRSQCCTRYGG